MVTITEEGGIFINDVYRPADAWEEELQRAIRKKPDQKGYLRADENVPYRAVVDVLTSMKRLGLTDVGLVTRPADEKNRKRPDGWG